MKRPLLLLCAALGAAASAAAQAPYPAGFRDEAFGNVTSDGSPRLAARVWYPAQRSGENAPLRPRAGGWPWIVFLHGVGGLARHYGDLGEHFASHGYVFVAQDTAQFEVVLQWQDARALWPTLRAETAREGTFWYQAFDPERSGIAGHSMGGGNTTLVLASNPGYRCGFTFAPVAYGPSAVGHLVTVPWAGVHGQGDGVLDWRVHAVGWFQHLTRYSRLKAMVLLDEQCNHYNVAIRMPNPTPADLAIFARVAAAATGFFDCFLNGESAGLEEVMGRSVQVDPYLVKVLAEVEAPELWRIGASQLGGSTVVSLAAEPGPAGILLAPLRAAAPVATPFGWLLLEPATAVLLAHGDPGTGRRLDMEMLIPDDPALRNATVTFQGIGWRRAGGFRFSNALDLTIR